MFQIYFLLFVHIISPQTNLIFYDTHYDDYG